MRRAFYRRRMPSASFQLRQPSSVTLIAGPTASGKSALALEMARETGAVIINADSQQLYADLRILTARPSIEDERQADHRLYGMADATEVWSVGRWLRASAPLIKAADIERRPILIVGGTGLYFTALLQGLVNLPDIDDDERKAAETIYDHDGEEAVRRLLREDGAQDKIAPGDRQRLVRALSVLRATGRTLTAWQADTRPAIDLTGCRKIITGGDRRTLYERCEKRVDLMIDGGALDEVARLLRRELPPTLPVMKAVGVREFGEYLTGKTTLEQASQAVRQATRRYIKRQLTWMRARMADWDCVEVAGSDVSR